MATTRVASFSLAAAALIATGATAQSADPGGRKLQTSLSGAAEVPGPGDTDGSGSATVTVNSGQSQVCYTLSVSSIAAATMAHIHKGAPTDAGPVVVALTAPDANGKSEGCATIERSLALDILKSPADYYVNVHNEPFPGGALRGQLAK